MIRTELTGMLPAAIAKIEKLLEATAALNPKVVRGYDPSAGPESYFFWGCACRIRCDDMEALKAAADAIGFLCLNDEGDLAYTDGLSIDDFLTYRVNGELELTPEKEV